MILLCSAWQEEIKYLNASELGNHFLIEALGIGYLDAALNLERIIKKNDLKQIIFLGTAGSFNKNHDEIVEVESTELLNIGSNLDISYPAKHGRYEVYKTEKKLSDLKTCHCLTTAEITKDSAFAELISKKYDDEILLENLELYGLAKVASEAGIPWNALLGVTNSIGENAHEEWKVNHERVSKNLCDYFKNSCSFAIA